MSVYVDPLLDTRQYPRFMPSKGCHLLADTWEELIAFMRKIGLEPSWARRSPLHHTTLTEPQRLAAIQAGAIQIEAYRVSQMLLAKFGLYDQEVRRA